MKQKLCRYCKQPIGKTRKYLCDSCRILAEIKADKNRLKSSTRQQLRYRENRDEWNLLSDHDQQELIFERAKQILRGLNE